MSFKVVFLVFLVHVGLFRIGNGGPVKNLLKDFSHCQARERHYAYSHLCFLSCESDGYCPDQSECLCDNRCGMSCINHDRISYCDPIPFPDNGFAILKIVGHDDIFAISHGAELDFYCNMGYVLVGQQRLSCMACGVWDNPPPICINILSEDHCGNPPSLQDATVTMCEDCVEEPIATYTCNSGFFLLGNGSVKCNNGIWESLDAMCLKKCCSLPNIPEPSLIEFNDLCSETELNFTCSEGYVLDGESQISCRPHDMTWSDSPPRCVPKQCDALQLGVNLHTNTDERIVGTLVTFRCSEGCILIGSANTVCLPNCSWSDGVPECQAITCAAPEVSSKNLFIHPVVKSVYFYGEMVTYGCRSRFNNIVGDGSRMCLHSGKFSGKEPTCHARCNMNKVSVVQNGVIVRSSEHYYFHGGWIEVYCRSTYRLVGASYFECKDGSWSSDLDPVCLKDASNDFVFPVVVYGYTINQVATVVQGSTVIVDCIFLSRSRRPSWIIDPRGSKKRQIPGMLHPPGNVYRIELKKRPRSRLWDVCLPDTI
ncbi:sushi, von Willebrand factor type A, EGF and pentraxin domain-containing protein 1-like [Anneissia japonica]|uniref:sushi, von Willebrand factor type A, EGF and pentraxin domain-containing protein 1-like n=1 Tax=Anneissia japonica TaxID=1529436 RepID=UPI0014255FAB|nr:sushi, von Willebrand factor type A, EGF and pentraxin domain-containing protein 1-like [Anneissia japonica]